MRTDKTSLACRPQTMCWSQIEREIAIGNLQLHGGSTLNRVVTPMKDIFHDLLRGRSPARWNRTTAGQDRPNLKISPFGPSDRPKSVIASDPPPGEKTR